jgi:hypothetical protein
MADIYIPSVDAWNIGEKKIEVKRESNRKLTFLSIVSPEASEKSIGAT